MTWGGCSPGLKAMPMDTLGRARRVQCLGAEDRGAQSHVIHPLWRDGQSRCLPRSMKLQYFGHLMQRTDSLEKTLMLGKIEGRRRRGRTRAAGVEIQMALGGGRSQLFSRGSPLRLGTRRERGRGGANPGGAGRR